MKTDPRIEVLGVVGAVTYTLPPLYDGWTVTALTGGTVTRSGALLAVGATLATGDTLAFNPTATGGTVNVTVRQEDAEFSGLYSDLTGAPVDGPGGSSYSETVLFGNPTPPSPGGDAIQTRGLEFVASVGGTVNAVRCWARLEAGSSRRTAELNAEIIINDHFRSSVPVTLARGRWAQVTAPLATPVPIAAGDRVGVVLQSLQELPELLSTYVEANDDYYALGYGQLNGYIDNLSVSEPITYVRTPDGDTGGSYPALQLLTTSGTAPTLPHARYPAVTGTAGAWALVDSRPADGAVPAVQALHDGRIYRAPLWPDAPSGDDPDGLYLPQVPAGTTLLPRRLAWRGGQVIATDATGLETILSGGGGGVDAEAVQDIVAAMLGSAGTYDDAAGTYTLPPDQTLTPEQVQDIVAAFTQAGTNATVTYDDAANTLTISATGGGSGGVTSVAGRTGAVTLTSADLADFVEAAQDAAGALLADSTDLDWTYNDAANTEAVTVTGLRGKALPSAATLTAGLSIRVAPDGQSWETYTPGSGGGLIIRETDGNPSAVFTTLEVPNGTLQDGGNGKAIYMPSMSGVYLGTTAPPAWSVASNATLATTNSSPPVTMPFDATASVVFDKIYLPYSANSAIPNGLLVEVLVGGSVVASGTVGAGSYNATFNRLAQLNATVTRSAGQAFSLRFSANGSGWDGKFTVVTNGAFPYVYGSGGGIRQTDAPVVPYYPLALTFAGPGGTTKNTTGPGFTVGSTAERPASPAIGDQHMDTTLSKPVWWWGSAWKDATGATV